MGPHGQAEAGISYADRLIGILAAMADGPEIWSIKDLSERLGIAPSSIHRVLSPLVAAGMIERAPQRRYRIGAELFRIAARVESRFQLASAARPIMEGIASESGESCLLGILNASHKSVVVAHTVERRLPLGGLDDLLANAPPVRSALGRAIMAWLGYNEVRAMSTQSAGARIDSALLQQNLSIIRRRGLAAGTRVCGGAYVLELAAPFFDGTGKVRGSIGIVVPKLQMRHRVRELGKLLGERAADLSRQLAGGIELVAEAPKGRYRTNESLAS